MDKEAIIDLIIAELQQEADSLARAAKDSHAYATDEDSQSESKYDTRGLEASYLAGAQAEKATEVLDAIRKYQALKNAIADNPSGEGAGVGKLVLVEGPAGEMAYFLGPDRGGLEIESEGVEVMVITPDAPIARAMEGLADGQEFSFNGRSGWKILSVR